EPYDADLFSGQLFGLANLLLRNEAERKRVERARDHHQFRALSDSVDRRHRVDLSEVGAVAYQRLDLARRTRREHQFSVDAIFGKQAKLLGRPERGLKAGKTSVSDDLAILGPDAGRQQQHHEHKPEPL